MMIEEVLRERRDEIHRIAAKHGVTTLRVFGSVARGEARPDSDIDLLIETGPVTSSWFPAGLIVDLEQLLGRRVEVVTERALNPALREAVLREAKPL
jgi:predicted nucleotidyltransferase